MSLFACKHSSLTAIDKNGYQYCKKCGKAFAAPCSHHWVEKGRMEVARSRDNASQGYRILLQCSKCGELKNHNFLTFLVD